MMKYYFLAYISRRVSHIFLAEFRKGFSQSFAKKTFFYNYYFHKDNKTILFVKGFFRLFLFIFATKNTKIHEKMLFLLY